MGTVGIICEYNPFHLGHGRQLALLRRENPEETLVCLMSGNYVQRGKPAIFDRTVRAKAAILGGADLVLELPVNVSLRSAEGFADGGIEILSSLGLESVCFGAETREAGTLMEAAEILLTPEFSQELRHCLERGLSFPAARQQAVQTLGGPWQVLSRPNDILAVEYCKAVLRQGSALKVRAIHRQGDYHALQADPENPSATALRSRILAGEPWTGFVPEAVAPAYEEAAVHCLTFGERAVLGKLRSMTREEFEAVPYGSEGLWRKLMHESRHQNCLEDILTAVKSKRYTRSRLDRMVLCAFLGLTEAELTQRAPYVRVLAMNGRGRTALKAMGSSQLVHLGERIEGSWAETEERCTRLYGLFAREPELPRRAERVAVLP